MDYVLKMIVLLCLAGYVGFMDYGENPERYAAIDNKSIAKDTRLSLSYELKKYSSDGFYINGKAKMTNHTDQDLYFCYSTCRYLNENLKVKNLDAYIGDRLFTTCCFVSAVKDTIKANSAIDWEFGVVTEEENIKTLELEYTFVELTADSDFYNNSIYQIAEEDVKGAFVIQGKPTKIQKIKGENPRFEAFDSF